MIHVHTVAVPHGRSEAARCPAERRVGPAGFGSAVRLRGGLALMAALALPGCDPGATTRSEPLPKLGRLEGWVPYWTREETVVQAAVAAGFTDILLFHATVEEKTGRVKLEKPDGLERGRQAAEQGGARTWLTATNHGKSLEGALGAGRVAAHVESLLAAFTSSRCRHLDIDYESLTPAQAQQLPELARQLDRRLAPDVRLGFTLQPVDSVYRPEQREMVRTLLAMPRVHTVRFMMYDYAWRTSLPGALCPLPAYRRLIEEWAAFAPKITVCLPLYGYDWPRPEDTTLPPAETVVLHNVRALPARFFWLHEEEEMAAFYARDGVPRMVAVPSYRAVNVRVRLALDLGIPAAAFWHLGAGAPERVVAAAQRRAKIREDVAYNEAASWEEWLEPYKRRVCRTVTGDGRSPAELARAHGVALSDFLRFNPRLTGDTTGQTLYLPVKP
jgi:hypothetical protein